MGRQYVTRSHRFSKMNIPVTDEATANPPPRQVAANQLNDTRIYYIVAYVPYIMYRKAYRLSSHSLLHMYIPKERKKFTHNVPF
jgi:hypothetical protein